MSDIGHTRADRGGPPRSRALLALTLTTLLLAWTGIEVGQPGGSAVVAQADVPAPASSGLQDDSSPAVTWSGRHSTRLVAAAYDGSLVELAGRASATFTFHGAGAEWLARTGPFDGRARVYVDGRRTARVDLYARTKSYQQTAYRISGLRVGTHTLRVVRAASKNRRSTGRNVTVDGFRVLDGQPPSRPPSPSSRTTGTSVLVTWPSAPEDDVAGYRVSRSTDGGPAVVVGTTGPQGRQLVDVGLVAGASYAFALQVLDTSGNVSSRSAPTQVVVPDAVPLDVPRYATCPPATTTVGDVGALDQALREARPGTVIHLLPGRYPGQVDVVARGSAAGPIWVCGPRSAVLDGGGPTHDAGIRISGSTHLVVAGLTVRNSQKGVSVLGNSSIVLADLAVSEIGEEGVHLKAGTTDSTVIGNQIDRTGLTTPAYGEGIYVGTDHDNWCAWLACGPDRSDRDRLEQNTISRTAAEPIEVKEGTSDGMVADNHIDSSGSQAGRLIALKGTAWTVSGNVGTGAEADGVQVLHRVGYGVGNAVFGNVFDGRLRGFGVRMPPDDPTNVVGCDNRVLGGAGRVSNVTCQP